MAQTLGEKLREAREARHISLSEVAEQTRISPYYIEAIERDDYKPLPGGIFNKGFVKSFAKFVGVDENEALADYLNALTIENPNATDEPKSYRPEVLTDDTSSRTGVPTVLIAVVILGAMTAIVLVGLKYFWESSNPATVADANSSPAANTSAINANTVADSSTSPEFGIARFEFKAVNQPVSLTATDDGRVSTNVVTPGSVSSFVPKKSLKLSYSKSLASAASLTINGKPITLPAQPLEARRAVIEFEINAGNFASIWTNGAISTGTPSATPNANLVSTRSTPAAAVNASIPRSNAARVNAPSSNARPSPTGRVIVVGNSNRAN